MGGFLICAIALALLLLYFRRQRRQPVDPKDANEDSDPDVVTWAKAELENNHRYELTETGKTRPELGAESREELPADYPGFELRDTSRRSSLRLGVPQRPTELPTTGVQRDLKRSEHQEVT